MKPTKPDAQLTRSMSKPMARRWLKLADVINPLEQARRKEFSLTSNDLYPSIKPRNSEQKD
jgi:hypothetical protein